MKPAHADVPAPAPTPREPEQPPYDAVLCVGPQHARVAAATVRSLLTFARARRLLLVAGAAVCEQLDAALRGTSGVQLILEDELLAPVSLATVREALRRRCGSGDRAGWYFQQFLKMGICRRPDIGTHYLVWDSDTVLLRPLGFFDAHTRVLVNPKPGLHPPYFRTLLRLTGIERQVPYSFISEHLMMSTAQMRALLELIERRHPTLEHWTTAVLAAVDDADLPGSGFSEFETYGNFVLDTAPASLQLRPLKTLRRGSRLFGSSPSPRALRTLMEAGYDTVTFETWDHGNPGSRALGGLWSAVGPAIGAIGALGRPPRGAATSGEAAFICGGP